MTANPTGAGGSLAEADDPWRAAIGDELDEFRICAGQWLAQGAGLALVTVRSAIDADLTADDARPIHPGGKHIGEEVGTPSASDATGLNPDPTDGVGGGDGRRDGHDLIIGACSLVQRGVFSFDKWIFLS